MVDARGGFVMGSFDVLVAAPDPLAAQGGFVMGSSDVLVAAPYPLALPKTSSKDLAVSEMVACAYTFVPLVSSLILRGAVCHRVW